MAMNKLYTVIMTIALTACGGGGSGGTDVALAAISGSASAGGNSGNGGNNTTASVSFSASSNQVVKGDSTTLHWNSSEASTCTASGEWSGTKSLNGSQSVTLDGIGIYTFSIDCSGATATIDITVNETDSEGSCTNPHTAKIEKNYLGDFDYEQPQNYFGNDHIKGVGLKDYGLGWIYDTYKSKEPSVVANCTRTEYIRLMYRETIRRLRDHGVTSVQIYNFGRWDDSKQTWEVVHSTKHITDEEVDFITQTAKQFGMEVHYGWQFNMEVADANGTYMNRLLFPMTGGNVLVDMELLTKIMDAHEQHIYWEADRAEFIGIDALAADWQAMWIDFRGLDREATFEEETELRNYYMERLSTIVAGVRSRFNGKIIIGEGITWNDGRVWDNVDIIKLGFPMFVGDDELEDTTVDMIDNRAYDYIERAYNAFYCYDGQWQGHVCGDYTSYEENKHKFMFDLFAQSHMGFLSRGWIEDGFCVEGILNNIIYDCIQREVQPDFSAQALWYEGVLRAIDRQTWFDLIGTTTSTGYWLSDTLMHDGHTEAFPSTSQSIRGKPAEKILKYWYTGLFEQYEPIYD
jgi:hypothetical protein